MYLFISPKDRRWFYSADPVSGKECHSVPISEDLEAWPIIVWLEDGAIDYLEVNRFGDILRREFVWPPMRYGETPVVSIKPVICEDVPVCRVALSRLNRLINDKKTMHEYTPDGISIYFDPYNGHAFYRIPWNDDRQPITVHRSNDKYMKHFTVSPLTSSPREFKCFDAVTGQRLSTVGPEIEEVVYPSMYRPYPSSCKRFNLVLLSRPSERRLYLYNAVSGNLLSTTSSAYAYDHYLPNREFALGVFVGKAFFRPNPNMCRKFYKHLPMGSLKDVDRVQVIPSYSTIIPSNL
jgi:hypothetical protein